MDRGTKWAEWAGVRGSKKNLLHLFVLPAQDQFEYTYLSIIITFIAHSCLTKCIHFFFHPLSTAHLPTFFVSRIRIKMNWEWTIELGMKNDCLFGPCAE